MPPSGPRVERRRFLKLLGAGTALTATGLAPQAFSAALSGNVPLDGTWSIRLDPGNIGITEAWFSARAGQGAQLPHALPALGLGAPPSVDTQWTGTLESREYYTADSYAAYRQPDNFKIPFFLQPETYYAGAAWYQRDITVPKTWAGKRVELSLERSHWETRVWLDDRFIGQCESLSTAHAYDLGLLKPGTYRLSIRVDNSLIHNIGTNSHAISDHTQGNWNGIAGDIVLKATDATWIDDLQLYPNAETRTVRVVARIKTHTAKAGAGTVELTYGGLKKRVAVTWTAEGGRLDETVRFPSDAALWDEFSPNLHHLSARLGASDAVSVRFGFRDLGTTSSHITINGRQAFMRGTLECAIFPETGHPPTDKAAWTRIFRIARSFGLNLMRFHSYCPPKAAFDAADEQGFYCQVETCWANASTTLGDGKPVDAWVLYETDRVLKAYGNHPSFVFMLYGNEPSGPKDRNPYLSRYVDHYKKADGRMLWSGGAGWPEIPENQFHVVPEPRIQAWGDQLNSRVNGKPPETVTDYSEFMAKRQVPVMSHEIGQWCVYPDLDEVSQYTGYLKPRNFEIFRQRLADNGLSQHARDFLIASGKLQTLLYKEDIESALRTPNMAGFQLLDLHDFPGQGTALVGVLNPFWREKGYVTAAEYSRFCNVTVPLARLSKRVFTTAERLTVQAEISHFGATPLAAARPYWRLEADGQVLRSGEMAPAAITIGAAQAMGQIDIDLGFLAKATACRLVVGVRGEDGTQLCENDWDVWVYPATSAPAAPSVKVVNSADTALDLTAKGETVILSIPRGKVRNFDTKPVTLGFSAIFWNTSWTNRQAPTTLGILCDPAHPAFAAFPTDSHTNWQWWYIIHRAAPLRVDLMPKGTRPIVRVIDDWFTARSLALVSEFRCGKGKLIVCGFDLTGAEAQDPVSRQMRDSLGRYAASGDCAPETTIDAATLKALIV
ncbi:MULTISPECIES: sugar-binding domain-containing protein [Asticcacaulis]|uniref:sugar-binding domain-containing protein n=1 Tax=Asticcacaulis TaxID=76890 RepID=UPI001AE8969D|nr:MULTISPECIES: sugar-binding domain-containing protein [Asticcacaulis]MBP2160320.1 hypothetical protein [Asticcacaulis solisilvae]MDR6801377.1 hypothetical protein [Asticcacaulis sp. BE141]